MADMGGVGAALGGNFPLEQWFFEMPFCTRWWTAGVAVTSLLVQCHVISPFNMFYSTHAIFTKSQYWRLLSSFFYFGPLGIDLVFHVFFLQRYSRLIEESSGRTPARFAWMLTFCATMIIFIAPWFHIFFLGTSLSSVLVYVWARRNPDAMLSFLGLLTFRAPWLPWVLMAFSFVMHGIIPKDEIVGVIVGHVWYYFNDIYPPVHGSHRPLEPPRWWLRLWENEPEQDDDEGAAETENEVRGLVRPIRDIPGEAVR